MIKFTNYGTHFTISLGKSWISFDKTGMMGWNNRTQKNFYWLYNRSK